MSQNNRELKKLTMLVLKGYKLMVSLLGGVGECAGLSSLPEGVSVRQGASQVSNISVPDERPAVMEAAHWRKSLFQSTTEKLEAKECRIHRPSRLFVKIYMSLMVISDRQMLIQIMNQGC